MVAKGRLSASSEDSATQLLSFAGYQVVSLRPLIPRLNLSALANRFARRVKPTEIILFYRQLSLLLGSGIDIVTSLELLQRQTSSRRLMMTLGEVISELHGGSRLSTALGKHPDIFSSTAARLLHIGEESGSFESTLKHLADYTEKEVVAAKGLRSALMYPVMAAIATVALVIVLLTFVLPAFSDLYATLGAELPAMTRALLQAGDIFRQFGVYLLLAMAVILGLALAYVRTPVGKYRWHRFILRLPLIGRISHLKELARACRSIALLFRAGLPITDTIRLTADACGNRVLAEAMHKVERDMIRGEGLSQPMSKNPVFLPLMVQMVRIGEETGNLDSNLEAVADNYEVEAEDKTHSVIGLIQPAMTLGIGFVVGLIAVSLTSAMYSIYGQGI